MLFHVVRGMAQTIAESRFAATAGDTSEWEWWSRRSAALNQVVADFAERFPLSTWLAGERSTDTTDDATPYLEGLVSLALGLLVLFNLLEATAEARQNDPSSRSFHRSRDDRDDPLGRSS